MARLLIPNYNHPLKRRKRRESNLDPSINPLSTDPEVRPYHKQVWEPSFDFHCFQHYITLPDYRRSALTAFWAHLDNCEGCEGKESWELKGHVYIRGTDRIPIQWNNMRHRNRWVERAEAYDEFLVAEAHAIRAERLATALEKYEDMSSQLAAKILERIQDLDPDEINVKELASLLRATSGIELETLGHVPGERERGQREKEQDKVPQVNVNFVNTVGEAARSEAVIDADEGGQ